MPSCARPGCGEVAAAKLAADFNRRIGWLRDLDAESTQQDYSLCVRHADRLTLPLKWELHDERTRRLRSVPTMPPRVEAHVSTDTSAPTPEPAPPTLPPAAAEPESLFTPAPDAPSVADAPEDPSSAAASAATHALVDDDFDPSDGVNESTPLLSRAFRAAVPGHRDD